MENKVIRISGIVYAILLFFLFEFAFSKMKITLNYHISFVVLAVVFSYVITQVHHRFLTAKWISISLHTVFHVIAFVVFSVITVIFFNEKIAGIEGKVTIYDQNYSDIHWFFLMVYICKNLFVLFWNSIFYYATICLGIFVFQKYKVKT